VTSFDRSAIEGHVQLLHELAAATNADDDAPGVLILLPICEGASPRPQRFAIGNVSGMVEAVMAFDGVHGTNIYAPYATMFSDLRYGGKGSEKNVKHVFAAVADIDRDPGKPVQAEIPVAPSYAVETSPGNYQYIYVFPRPLCAQSAKPVLCALHAAIGGDAAQKDISHVWRIPGTLNWPTKSKLARGRSPEPAPVTVVKACNGMRVDPVVLLALPPLPKPEKKAKRNKGAHVAADEQSSGDIGEAKLRAALATIPADDRDIWLKVGMALHTINARDMWDWWAQTSDKYDAADQERIWASFNDDRNEKITIASIYALAKEDAPRRKHRKERERSRSSDGFVRGDADQILRGRPDNIKHAVALLGVTLRQNDFSAQIEIDGLPKFGPHLDDAGVTRMRFWTHETYGFLPALDLFEQTITDIAHAGRYHPIRAYLDGLEWDRQPRLATWLHDTLGAEKSLYTGTIGTCFFVGLVARIFRPGCKQDYMPILEGPQGALKSAACEIIAGEWFFDNLPDVRDHKDLAQHLPGKWLIEIGELSAMSRAETTTLKAFITRTVERYRPSYGRREVIQPRQCCFIGTTNDDCYLKDATGGRRFWPVKIGAVDLDALRRVRDQLFAEAVHLFKAGAAWWPDKDLEATCIRPEQDARFVEDPWQEAIAKFIENKDQTTVAAVAKDGLFLDTAHIGPRERDRIIAVLVRLGWARHRSHGVRQYKRKET
jgi:predicted P-loop ATPase